MLNTSSIAVAGSSLSLIDRRLGRTGIVIPTYNASRHWARLHAALVSQQVACDQVIVVDSSSSDNTVALARRAGYRVVVIPRESFRHGATRQMASTQMPWAEVLIYLTQDAIPSRGSIEELLSAFSDPTVGAAYGRQLPREDADSIERHARYFNYPPASDVRDFDSRKSLGFKAIFFSNSFAAYRRSALEDVGGFPENVIFGEDTVTAAKLLIAGYKTAYMAKACVYHSHAYTWRQEFKRYFDIGVLHNRERWLLEEFGGTKSEGGRFVLSELKFLCRQAPELIPSALARTGLKFFGYRLGKNEGRLNSRIKHRLSMNSAFWEEDRNKTSTRSLSKV